MEITRLYVVQRLEHPDWLDVGSHADVNEAMRLRDKISSWSVVRVVKRTETVIDS
jgi:hypothetical protein